MKPISTPVVFFGSGAIAAESLLFLHTKIPIEAIITKPKPAHHRGEPPVLVAAKQLSVPVYTPENKKALSGLFSETTFTSKVGLVIDYGIIIEKKVIDSFPLGIANSHFSLLPEWRGPDPIRFSILSGQEETGVSLMLINEKMDEGPLLAQSPISLTGKETYEELRDTLVDISNHMLVTLLPKYIGGDIVQLPQEVATRAPSTVPSYSTFIKKEDGKIDWLKPAEAIEREIRAYSMWPKSYTDIAGKSVVITSAEVIDASGEPGQLRIKNKHELIIYCSKKALKILALKPAGKKEMTAKAFLAGHKVL